jgi:hypothetical protein
VLDSSKRRLGSEAIWRAAAQRLFREKHNVSELALRLLTPGNGRGADRNRRADLEAMSVGALKRMAELYRVNVRALLEKDEIVKVLDRLETRHAQPGECLSRLAVRLAWLDRKRNFIGAAELSSFEWRIRVRADGPLAHLVPADPFYRHEPASRVTFRPDGVVEFVGGPFAWMNAANHEMLRYVVPYRLSSFVSLSVGVREFVARHPVHWGFILMSSATLWTAFEMPRDDPVLEDGAFESLLGCDRGFCVYDSDNMRVEDPLAK